MKVKDCMCKDVVYLKGDSTVTDCAKLMQDKHVGCIPVCDEAKKVVGIVTDRDIILRTIACDKDVTTTPLSEIMTTKVYICHEEDEIDEAEDIMVEEQIRRLPVLNENGEISGMLTVGNLCECEEIDTEEIGETMEDICSSDFKNAE